MIQPADRAAWEEKTRRVWISFAAIVGGEDRIEAVRATP